MTIKEIIDGLKFTVDMFLFDPGSGEVLTEPRNDLDKTTIDACRGAIELLEKKSCDDAISRAEAIKRFTYNLKGERIPDYYCDNFPIQVDIKTVKEILRDLQPVTPQPKMGRWIKKRVDGRGIHYGYCSNCDYNVEKRYDYKYCPNCGIRMVDSQESEEAQPKQTDEEIKLGDEVVNKWGMKGVVVGIDTSYEGEVLLSLLMKNHKVPQLVQASNYKTKTSRHFPQIIEVWNKIKGESEDDE